MKLVSPSEYRKARVFFFAGLLWAFSVPSTVLLWKKFNSEVAAWLTAALNRRSGAGPAPDDRAKPKGERNPSDREPEHPAKQPDLISGGERGQGALKEF